MIVYTTIVVLCVASASGAPATVRDYQPTTRVETDESTLLRGVLTNNYLESRIHAETAGKRIKGESTSRKRELAESRQVRVNPHLIQANNFPAVPLILTTGRTAAGKYPVDDVPSEVKKLQRLPEVDKLDLDRQTPMDTLKLSRPFYGTYLTEKLSPFTIGRAADDKYPDDDVPVNVKKLQRLLEVDKLDLDRRHPMDTFQPKLPSRAHHLNQAVPSTYRAMGRTEEDKALYSAEEVLPEANNSSKAHGLRNYSRGHATLSLVPDIFYASLAEADKNITQSRNESSSNTTKRFEHLQEVDKLKSVENFNNLLNKSTASSDHLRSYPKIHNTFHQHVQLSPLQPSRMGSQAPCLSTPLLISCTPQISIGRLVNLEHGGY